MLDWQHATELAKDVAQHTLAGRFLERVEAPACPGRNTLAAKPTT